MSTDKAWLILIKAQPKKFNFFVITPKNHSGVIFQNGRLPGNSIFYLLGLSFLMANEKISRPAKKIKKITRIYLFLMPKSGKIWGL